MSTRIFARLPLLLRPVLRTASTPILPYAGINNPRLRSPLLFPFRSFRSTQRTHNRSPSPPPPDSPTSTANLTLSQRLKHLIKTYGWYALAVYLLVGVVDFGVAFAGISLFGAEHVSRAVATAKSAVLGFIHPEHPPEPGKEDTDPLHINPSAGGSDGLYAMLVLAYTVHKTLFMPVRIGVTAAFTPKIVGWLTKRGWAGRAGTKRAAEEVKERIRSRSRD
ncbi:hypothetical protein BDV98DRAFT_567115 [Pterulicium gracile]|uniref:DUF1279 domain-containing protein n=1 Tax=Pterulicium gracile TaxID=1884261 RepID=A0A5C3QHT3_9AGAR|nr:hypothetical protein BDV98DRAFT_567115 [Pterula gracilis]